MIRKKIVVVTCYKSPDYVRAVVLRNAVEQMKNVELTVIKNQSKSIFRYFEVATRLVWTRVTVNPDVYIVTFRGYEILPVVLLVAIGKRVIFDEFINLIEWTIFEHSKFSEKSIRARVLVTIYKILLEKVDLILGDTDVHVKYSAALSGISIDKYLALPVGSDETSFVPDFKMSNRQNTKLEVFYYGNMLPLHGIDIVCKAAIKVSKQIPNFHFIIVGGDNTVKASIENAKYMGADITYESFLPFEELATLAKRSDICLAGPFGGTLQASMVITGKTYQFIAAARPVVIGRINQKGPFVDKKNCLIVKQNNTSDLAKTLIWAENNRDKLEQIGAEGRKLYLKHYSQRRISQILSNYV